MPVHRLFFPRGCAKFRKFAKGLQILGKFQFCLFEAKIRGVNLVSVEKLYVYEIICPASGM